MAVNPGWNDLELCQERSLDTFLPLGTGQTLCLQVASGIHLGNLLAT